MSYLLSLLRCYTAEMAPEREGQLDFNAQNQNKTLKYDGIGDCVKVYLQGMWVLKRGWGVVVKYLKKKENDVEKSKWQWDPNVSNDYIQGIPEKNIPGKHICLRLTQTLFTTFVCIFNVYMPQGFSRIFNYENVTFLT